MAQGQPARWTGGPGDQPVGKSGFRHAPGSALLPGTGRSLNRRQMNLNRRMLQKAIESIPGAPTLQEDTAVARMPGQLIAIKNRRALRKHDLAKLESLLQERIETIPVRASGKDIISWATGGGPTRMPSPRTTSPERHTSPTTRTPGKPGPA